MKKLAAVKANLDVTFDPLSPTVPDLIGKPVEEQAEAAKEFFVSRINSMLRTISHSRQELKSFLQSLKRAVRKGAPIPQYLGAVPHSASVLSADTAFTRQNTTVPAQTLEQEEWQHVDCATRDHVLLRGQSHRPWR